MLGSAVPFAVPLSRRFRGVQQRAGLLLHGSSGWGEFAPFAEYDAPATARWLAAAVEAAYGEWPAAVRDSVPVNAIVPAVRADDAAALVRQAVTVSGVATVKVKVAEAGEALADDVARVAAVRAALGSAGRIRVDVNGHWSVDDAAAALPLLDEAAGGLEYVEQPVATLAELAALRRRVAVPVAADETFRSAADLDDPALHAGLREAADVVVLKVSPLGGVGRALELAARVGLPVVVSGAMDSAVGLSAGVALAAALPRLDYACGLGTGALLAADVVDPPLTAAGGTLRPGRVEPDPAALAVAAGRVDTASRLWWHERLTAAWVAGARDRVGHLVAA
ncbi:MAG: O-succinylbenzoate synthase [Actinomycetota bacterium]|nr:MAG: O-succinylbenzoate synthase [Actinomycetota bacterium]